MDKFLLDRRYPDLLEYIGLVTGEVLKKAQLPEDLFSHKAPSMTTTEYFRFMDAISELSDNETTALKIGLAENLEAFSPPIFAAFCSKNALVCVNRLAIYKRLICPLVLLVNQDNDSVTIELIENKGHELPKFLVLAEMVFLVNLIRGATKEHIAPKELMIKHAVSDRSYSDFFGVEPKLASKNMLVLSLDDALKPFISQNDAMWDYFEPELKRRLGELEVDDSVVARVRSALTELLPSGESGVEEVSKRLGYSRRTLQRKLSDENTTFQKQLNHTRSLLAKHYLNNTHMTSSDIAYLLGYQDLNSFFRAFHAWTGMTISQYKRSVIDD
jgi:AraC-like DNA-binding protein